MCIPPKTLFVVCLLGAAISVGCAGRWNARAEAQESSASENDSSQTLAGRQSTQALEASKSQDAASLDELKTEPTGLQTAPGEEKDEERFSLSSSHWSQSQAARGVSPIEETGDDADTPTKEEDKENEEKEKVEKARLVTPTKPAANSNEINNPEVYDIPFTNNIDDPNAPAKIVKPAKPVTMPEQISATQNQRIDPVEAVLGDNAPRTANVQQQTPLQTGRARQAGEKDQSVPAAGSARGERTTEVARPVVATRQPDSSPAMAKTQAAPKAAVAVDSNPRQTPPAKLVEMMPIERTEGIRQPVAKPVATSTTAEDRAGTEPAKVASVPIPAPAASIDKQAEVETAGVALPAPGETVVVVAREEQASGPREDKVTAPISAASAAPAAEMAVAEEAPAKPASVEASAGKTLDEAETTAETKRIAGLLARHVEAPSSPVAFIPVAAPIAGEVEPAEEVPTTLVTDAHKAEAKEGAEFYLKGKKLLITTFDAASLDTVKRNLTIRFQQQAHESAREEIIKANAEYDTIIAATVSYARSDNFKRQEKVGRLRPEVDEDDVLLIGNIIVDGQEIGTKEIFVKGGFEHNIKKEFPNLRGRDHDEDIFFGITQRIRWGSVLNFGLSEQYFTVATPKNTQQRPWTTDLTLNATVPIPWFKNWGPYGSTEAGVKIAKASRDRAYWTLQQTINDSLSEANAAYWNVVGAFNRLAITTQIRKNIEELAKKTEERIKAQQAIAYEKYQVEAELGRILTSEQSAWASYISASNALVRLLDYDRKVIIIPARYTARLAEERTAAIKSPLMMAYDSNPALQGAMADVRLAQINHKFARNQARPELVLTLAANMDQSDAVYGYGTLLESYNSLLQPDKTELFAGLNFSVPWGNETALAQLQQAEQGLRETEKTLKAAQNLVSKQIQDALVGISTTRQRVALTRQNQDAAESVYKTILELWEKGRVPALAEGRSNPAFEILRKNNDLLSARLAHVDAKIEFKLAEESLMGALGTLSNQLSQAFDIQVHEPEIEKPEEAEGIPDKPAEPPPEDASAKEAPKASEAPKATDTKEGAQK